MPIAISQKLLSFTQIQAVVTQTLNTDFKTFLNSANLPEPLKQACHYVMLAGGKRVRPLLVACGYLTIRHSTNHSETNFELSGACRRAMLSVEMLHAYSLIHDDLPCMDDDNLRRGKATCHIAFDEATALLAGDVLQTLAFEVLNSDIKGLNPISDKLASTLVKILSPRARRMVAGQMLDLNAENKTISQYDLEAIHRDKTGALIEAAVLMGGTCAEANIEQLQSLADFTKHIGLAFQVQDDILDVTASTDDLGKPSGSDERLNKSTYVKLMGIDDANAYAMSLFTASKAVITDKFGDKAVLLQLANWLWNRQN